MFVFAKTEFWSFWVFKKCISFNENDLGYQEKFIDILRYFSELWQSVIPKTISDILGYHFYIV